MSFSTQALMYGWTVLASLGDLTGPTIYNATNVRHQIKAEDVIPIELGVYERCLATQTGTNTDGSPVYAVSPTNLIQTWTSNVYTTNGVTIYTNITTNTIGWHPNMNYMIVLDPKIKALVPYYADTNTVYDGTTNIVMLTVTGLWASLQIGNKTNQFTREPAWTNPISTKWIVNYTSYWPSTSGVATNINYTSDYQQVVNYASSWTATGGHVWVAASNWASSVVTITNAGTYGDYPWQIYVEDLQERYKVLNALKVIPLGLYGSTSFPTVSRSATVSGTGSTTGGYCNLWFGNNIRGLANGTDYGVELNGEDFHDQSGSDHISFGNGRFWVPFGHGKNLFTIVLDTGAGGSGFYQANITLDADPSLIKIWNCIPLVASGTNPVSSYTDSSADGSGYVGGESVIYFGVFGTVNLPFLYCTNKYW